MREKLYRSATDSGGTKAMTRSASQLRSTMSMATLISDTRTRPVIADVLTRIARMRGTRRY
jgi:hypothetical protein